MSKHSYLFFLHKKKEVKASRMLYSSAKGVRVEKMIAASCEYKGHSSCRGDYCIDKIRRRWNPLKVKLPQEIAWILLRDRDAKDAPRRVFGSNSGQMDDAKALSGSLLVQ